MIMPVQRPRGVLGLSERYRHLRWPSDVTEEQIKNWKEEKDMKNLTVPNHELETLHSWPNKGDLPYETKWYRYVVCPLHKEVVGVPKGGHGMILTEDKWRKLK